MSKSLTIKPLINEKTYQLFKDKNVYVFNVPKDVNKHAIKAAIQAQFEVDVITVNTSITKGKPKRTMSLSGRRSVNSNGKRSDFKKAYASIKKGQALPFFESVKEAEEKRETNQAKFDEAAQKQAEKDSKVQQKASKAPTKRRFMSIKKPESK